jgi:hypothetical protein
MMFLNKLKMATAVLLIILPVGLGFGGLLYQTQAAGRNDAADDKQAVADNESAQERPKDKQKAKNRKGLLKKLQKEEKESEQRLQSLLLQVRKLETKSELRKLRSSVVKLEAILQEVDDQESTVTASGILWLVQPGKRGSANTVADGKTGDKILPQGTDVDSKPVRPRPSRLVDVPLMKNALITNNGKVATLADLKVGMRVTLELAAGAQEGLVVAGIYRGERTSPKD